MFRFLSRSIQAWVRAAVAVLAALVGTTARAAPHDEWVRGSDAVFSNAFAGEPGATDIAQDAVGFLWIATQSGLRRWDGYHRRDYVGDAAVQGALPDSYLLSLLADSHGRLWVGTNSAGLVRYDPVHDRFDPALAAGEALSRNSVYALAEDGRGGLWIGTGGGLDQLDIASGHLRAGARSARARGLPEGGVRALLRCADGRLWVGTEHGLFRLDPGTTRFVAVALPTPEGDTPIVRRLLRDHDGRIWIGTHVHGVFVAQAGADAARPLRGLLGEQGGAGTETVTALEATDDGQVWVGFSGEGILRVDTRRWQARRERHQEHGGGSLADDDVGAMRRDARGLVWVATDTAVSFHATRGSLVATWLSSAHERAISHPNVASVLARLDGRVWLGLGDGGIDIIESERGRVAQLRPDPSTPQAALPKGRVLSMLPAADGSVFIGTQRGLYHADPDGGHLERIPVQGRPLTASVWTMAWQGRRLWLGGIDGLWGLERAVDGRMRVVAREDGGRLGDQRLTALLPAPDGALWVGTWSGLVRLVPGTMTVSRMPLEAPGRIGVPAAYISSLLLDRGGRLWVAAFGVGVRVLEWSPGRGEPLVRRVSTAEGLPNNGINALVLDGRGTVWASTDDGLVQIEPASLAVQSYGAPQGVGIRTYWTGAGTLAADGHVLFGGAGGLTIVDPGAAATTADPVALAMTEVRLGEATPWHGYQLDAGALPLVIEPDRRSLLVEFAALDFIAPQARRYEYRMRGVDRGWVESDAARRIAAYTNLPPGDHLLELRTAVPGGAWSEPVSLPVHVAPRWHETWWARAVLTLVAFGFLAGAVRARLALLRRRQRVLEGLVAERTRQLQDSQKQLEQIAYSDSLTGLANRRMFSEDLRRGFAHAARGGPAFALLLLDLDRFKQVNDTMGHDAGDAVLIAVARSLIESVREVDRVARLGGDEFAVLLSDVVGSEGLSIVCERILESVNRPMVHAQRTLRIGASIGAACAPSGASTPDALYKAADLALYEAKAAGRGCWRFRGDLAGTAT
ncbi:MAG: diguanylate cyclase domain-containing protein [Vitreoscilla sp.]